MNLLELKRKLLQARRLTPPDSRVPYTFEQRIMAHIMSKPVDLWHVWGRSMTRAAILCVVFVLALAAGSAFIPANNQVPLSQDVEQTLFAAVDNGGASVDQDVR